MSRQGVSHNKDQSGRPSLEVNEQLSSVEGEAESQSSESNCCVVAMNGGTGEDAELKLLVTKQAQCVDFCLGGDEGR